MQPEDNALRLWFEDIERWLVSFIFPASSPFAAFLLPSVSSVGRAGVTLPSPFFRNMDAHYLMKLNMGKPKRKRYYGQI